LFATPIGMPSLVVFAIAAVATLWLYSLPGGAPLGGYAMLAGAWAALGGYWFLRLVGALLAGGAPSVVSRWARWVAVPAIVVVTASLVVTSAPLRARVALSMASMNELARAAMQTPGADHPDRVGLFPVKRVDTFDGGMRFLVVGEDGGEEIPPVFDY
jgi:hypothetical protein